MRRQAVAGFGEIGEGFEGEGLHWTSLARKLPGRGSLGPIGFPVRSHTVKRRPAQKISQIFRRNCPNHPFGMSAFRPKADVNQTWSELPFIGEAVEELFWGLIL